VLYWLRVSLESNPELISTPGVELWNLACRILEFRYLVWNLAFNSKMALKIIKAAACKFRQTAYVRPEDQFRERRRVCYVVLSVVAVTRRPCGTATEECQIRLDLDAMPKLSQNERDTI